MSLAFYSRDSIPGLLAGTATVAALVIYQFPALAVAKDPQEIARFANLVTVQINPGQGYSKSGTGFIISKEGNTYTVLTCDHVRRDTGGRVAIIRTHDGQNHQVMAVQQIGNVEKEDPSETDLAILKFTSSTSFEVATIGDSSYATAGAKIYVYGYPTQRVGLSQTQLTNEDRIGEFTEGGVTSQPERRLPYGYNLRYSVTTLPSMSGGPVFDRDGRVVGVHGAGDLTQVKGTGKAITGHTESGEPIQTAVNVSLGVKTGFNNAIPINVYRKWREQNGNNQDGVVVDNSRSTDNPQQRLNNPITAEDFAIRGSVRQEQGDTKAAIEDFNRAISEGVNNALPYFNRGVARYNQGDYQGANQDFTQAISLSPNNFLAYFNRGLARQMLRDNEGMLQDFEKAISLDPSDPSAYNNRAAAKTALGDRPGAIADLTEALRLEPRLFVAYNNRAILRNRDGDKKGAFEDLSQVIRFDPKEAVAYYNRGLVRRDLGDPDGAIEDLQKAAELFEQRGDTNNYQKAQEKIESIQNARSADPTELSDPEIDSPESSESAPETEAQETDGEQEQAIPEDMENEDPQPL